MGIRAAMPLPIGWEARISSSTGLLEFHDHNNQRATRRRPEPPAIGEPCVTLLELPSVRERLGAVMQCATQWQILEAEQYRFSLMHDYWQEVQEVVDVEGSMRLELASQLELSLLNSAPIVVADLDGITRMMSSAKWCNSF